jgi:hypothetical protein
MKTKAGIYGNTSQFTTNLYDSDNIRRLLGLPPLNDTDKNSVHMHNSSIESESQSINKRLGTTSGYKSVTFRKYENSLDSRFGF